MNRRFLYMIVEAGSADGLCNLRRINPSRLFYPKDSPERAAAAVATPKAAAKARVVEDARLAPPTTTFRSYSAARFALLGRDKDKILVVGAKDKPFDRAVLYDDGSRTFHVLPSPGCTKISPFCVAVGNGVYFMEDVRQPDGSGDDKRKRYAEQKENIYTTTVDALVPPYQEDDGRYSWKHFSPAPQERIDWKSELTAYAAVDDSSIWVSTARHGTLALDTARRHWCPADMARPEWSKAGDWPLPFVGRASEQGGLWFGFSAGTVLEAWDLRADGGPASRLRWGDMPGIVGGTAVESEVAVLGDGRLCVGRLFEVPHPQRPRRHCPCVYRNRNRRKHPRARERPRPPRLFAMLTGVEVVDDGDGEGVRLIEHKSCRYNLGELEHARLLRRRKFAHLLF